MRRLFLLTMCLATPFKLLGEQAGKGALQDAEFVIEKERKILLQEAPRLFENAPAAPRVSGPMQLLPTNPLVIQPSFDTLPRKVKLLRAKQDMVFPLYGNYLQVGHGNFYTPYLEGFLTNTRDLRYAYGLHFKHLSAGQAGYGEENHNLVRLHGKFFTKTLWLGGEIGYSRDSYLLCNAAQSNGAPLKEQSLDHWTLRHTLANYTEAAINYQVEASLHYLAAPEQVRETQGVIQGSGDYTLNDEFTLNATADLYLTKYKDTYRNLCRLKPILAFTVREFDIQAGLNLVYQNSNVQGLDAFNLYPVLEVKYPLYQWLQPYAGLGGDVQRNTLQGFIQENPWLAGNAALRHTNQRFLFYGGAMGELMEQISFHIGLSLGSYKNLHCFVNSATHPGHFDLCYDPATMLLNAFGELTHTNKAENWTTRLRGDYFHYSLQELTQPWHRPGYRLDVLSTYRWHDKIVFKGTMYWVGGLRAQEVATRKAVTLPAVFDVGLGVDYLWNSRISIFLDCQNLLAKHNERYCQYPSRGFQFVAGLTYGW
ncbi:MAG: hypothetical protein AAFP88_02315 [Bacteroidota bacterium]